MIDFSQIDKFSWKYDLLNRYLRFNHKYVYYKEYRIVNQENIPSQGVPTFIIGNHQNGLTDALTLLHIFPDNRQPVFIARGDIFKKDSVAKILRFLKILPTFRTRDGERKDVRNNNYVFELAASILNRGKTLTMFPEASHQAGHYLSDFKKGFPRIALTAEEQANYQLGLKIVPVNIHYKSYFHFRTKLVLTVGEPFQIPSEILELHQTEPNLAFMKLNEIVREKLKAITIDEGTEYYTEYDQIREILYSPRLITQGKKPKSLYEEKEEGLKIVEELHQLRENDENNFLNLMETAKEYSAGLETLKLRNWLINKKVSFCSLFGKALLLLLTFPFYLFGLFNIGLPFHFPGILKKKIKDHQLHSSMNFAPAILLTFPLMFIILLTVVWIISGKFWIALIYLPMAFFSLFIYNAYRIAFIKWRGACRYYSLSKKKNSLLTRLSEIKSNLITNGIK